MGWWVGTGSRRRLHMGGCTCQGKGGPSGLWARSQARRQEAGRAARAAEPCPCLPAWPATPRGLIQLPRSLLLTRHSVVPRPGNVERLLDEAGAVGEGHGAAGGTQPGQHGAQPGHPAVRWGGGVLRGGGRETGTMDWKSRGRSLAALWGPTAGLCVFTGRCVVPREHRQERTWRWGVRGAGCGKVLAPEARRFRVAPPGCHLLATRWRESPQGACCWPANPSACQAGSCRVHCPPPAAQAGCPVSAHPMQARIPRIPACSARAVPGRLAGNRVLPHQAGRLIGVGVAQQPAFGIQHADLLHSPHKRGGLVWRDDGDAIGQEGGGDLADRGLQATSGGEERDGSGRGWPSRQNSAGGQGEIVEEGRAMGGRPVLQQSAPAAPPFCRAPHNSGPAHQASVWPAMPDATVATPHSPR